MIMVMHSLYFVTLDRTNVLIDSTDPLVRPHRREESKKNQEFTMAEIEFKPHSSSNESQIIQSSTIIHLR